jgi:hypothetical protein
MLSEKYFEQTMILQYFNYNWQNSHMRILSQENLKKKDFLANKISCGRNKSK